MLNEKMRAELGMHICKKISWKKNSNSSNFF